MTVRMAVVTCALVIAGAVSACGGGSGADDGQGEAADQESSAAPAPACATNARCYAFATSSDGWPDVNDDRHFAVQDPYLDGSYRLGARQSGSWNMAAPVGVSDLSADYSVQVDADATMAQAFPDEAAWGATCWTRPVGEDQIAGFGVYVQPAKVTIGVFDQFSGAFRPLKSNDAEGLVVPGEKSHLTMTCRQGTDAGSPVAVVQVELNGKPTVAVTYAKSVKNYSWQVADGVGLLAAGKGADVFYDNVVIAGK
jgi:hypothetical protein